MAFAEQYERLLELDKEIQHYDLMISHLCQTNELSKRMAEAPDVGQLMSTLEA